LPPRWNSWARQEWQPRDFERNQYHAKEQQHEHVTGIPPAQQRQSSQEEPRPKAAPTQVASSSGPQVNSSLLPTPAIPPKAPRPPTANQRKRENCRRNRRAMYQELQDLVLGSVHVRFLPEGQVHPFYDKFTLRLSPTLLQNERYKYLMDRLVPRPRQLQGEESPSAAKEESPSLQPSIEGP
jgi:hypothetical protein